MRLTSVSLAFAVAACGFQPSPTDESSVTLKLPPPKAAIGPGFSTPVTDKG